MNQCAAEQEGMSNSSQQKQNMTDKGCRRPVEISCASPSGGGFQRNIFILFEK
jgi:hypothetical protein